MVNWYAPDGCTIEFRSIDVKEGGSFHSVIHDPQHGDCWIKGIYHEVVFSEKLVFSMILSNEAGEEVDAFDAGKTEDWPKATIRQSLLILSESKRCLHYIKPYQKEPPGKQALTKAGLKCSTAWKILSIKTNQIRASIPSRLPPAP